MDKHSTELFDQIEREAWHTSLLEKSRPDFFGKSDDEIMANLRMYFNINTEAVVDYCMKNPEQCYNLNYVEAAKISGCHSSQILTRAALRDRAKHTEAHEVSEALEVAPQPSREESMRSYAFENLETAVRNDNGYMDYCRKMDMDPDYDTSVRGYAFTHGLVNKAAFFIIGGVAVFPLLYLYICFINRTLDFKGAVGISQHLVVLHDNFSFVSSSSNTIVVIAALVAILQAGIVVYKVYYRILFAIIGAFVGKSLALVHAATRG